MAYGETSGTSSPGCARVRRAATATGDDVLAIPYGELRGLAAGYFRKRPTGAMLEATALVHEAFLRVHGRNPSLWKDRAHFVAVCAIAMRGILTDHARRRRSAKRGGGWDRVPLSGVTAPQTTDADVDVEALDRAMEKLARRRPRQARIVECRFFSGMTVDEVAAWLDVSGRTVESDWRMARAWLSIELSKSLVR